jgi:hypothetical protein
MQRVDGFSVFIHNERSIIACRRLLCHEQLSYDWPFSELIAHCPPSPTPKPVPVPKFLPLGEIFTDADKLFLKDMKCLSQ